MTPKLSFFKRLFNSTHDARCDVLVVERKWSVTTLMCLGIILNSIHMRLFYSITVFFPIAQNWSRVQNGACGCLHLRKGHHFVSGRFVVRWKKE